MLWPFVVPAMGEEVYHYFCDPCVNGASSLRRSAWGIFVTSELSGKSDIMFSSTSPTERKDSSSFTPSFTFLVVIITDAVAPPASRTWVKKISLDRLKTNVVTWGLRAFLLFRTPLRRKKFRRDEHDQRILPKPLKTATGSFPFAGAWENLNIYIIHHNSSQFRESEGKHFDVSQECQLFDGCSIEFQWRAKSLHAVIRELFMEMYHLMWTDPFLLLRALPSVYALNRALRVVTSAQTCIPSRTVRRDGIIIRTSYLYWRSHDQPALRCPPRPGRQCPALLCLFRIFPISQSVRATVQLREIFCLVWGIRWAGLFVTIFVLVSQSSLL